MEPIRISVIIVSYNVRFFLEQCLQSVYRAGKGIPLEVFVVDNNSVDGSCMMVKEQFPEVRLIENRVNVGFSKANNQAMSLAIGEFQLILNPDTVVEEDSFRKILDFMDHHPEAGALGVKMIDGKGNFLPESKRALPTPEVSFYKIFGLSALFPRSKKFGQYHLGYLDKDQIHQVDILPGAFMFIRSKVLNIIGYFDETFFMYGEDIDLSHRIIQAGFVNYYFPETTIIHYKGESTKKGSLNYVMVFYQAMIIFATKHFSKNNARWYSLIIRIAIYLRAAMSMIRRLFKRFALPIADALLSFLGFILINPWWEAYKFGDDGSHPPEFLRIFVPAYILSWLTGVYFSGGYDSPVRLKRIAGGMLYGTAVILVLYSLLPEELRFSRALILLGAAWTLGLMVLVRTALHLIKMPGFQLDLGQKKRTIIVGNPQEAQRVGSLIIETGQKVLVAGLVSPTEEVPPRGNYIGSVDHLKEIIRINRINEIIFCAKDVSTNQIIRHMLSLSTLQTDYKIAPASADAIIGSNSVNTAGDLYVIPINSIGEPHNRRIKRLFDLFTALIILALSPILMWFCLPKPWKLVISCLAVLVGARSWIGYAPEGVVPGYHLPPIKKGILAPNQPAAPSPETWLDINLHYARDYRISRDLGILLRQFSAIGR
ncbi:MAG: glycosyltransferase [Bacteroidales bacterium]|nr:glycosyltransferase [Bacteroidales bacterium]